MLFKVRWEERNEVHAENPGGEEKAEESTQQYHSSISKWTLVSPVKSFCCINVWQNSQFPGKSQYNFLLLPLLSPHMFLDVLGCCCEVGPASERRQESTEAAKALTNNPGGKNTLAYIFYFIFFHFWGMERG